MSTSFQNPSQQNLQSAIQTQDWDELRTLLSAKPGLHRYMISGLYTTDPEALEPTLGAFEILAETFEIERLRDLGRKLLWMLNDESGNHCPNAALAMAHIARVEYDAIAPHLPVMQVHANDPGDQMAVICQQALQMINQDQAKVQQNVEPSARSSV
jgi:hypothetical protein